MTRAATASDRGLFTTFRDWLGLPGAPGTLESRVREMAVRSFERPVPACCPGCGGELRALELVGEVVTRHGMTRHRTLCVDCGVEEEWQQLSRSDAVR